MGSCAHDSDAPVNGKSARPINALLEDALARFGDRTAILHDQGRLTYRELDHAAARIAARLARHGVGPGDRVGLCSESTPEAIAALIGILRVGAAYVPFDPSYPPTLLRFIHDDSAPAALLLSRRQQDEHGQAPFWHGEPLLLDEPGEDDGDPPAAVAVGPEDLAYIMYTSGTTGRPKGVMVPHRAVVRLVTATDYVSLGPDEVILQQAPLSFDASTFEIWGALLNGGTLALPPGGRASLEDIAAAVRRFEVSTLWLTAGLFHLMVEHQLPALAGLRQLLAGGDVLSPAAVERVRSALPNCRLINGYGPTENTTFSCCYTVPPGSAIDGAIPIGTPIVGTHVHIVDENLAPVAPGEAGELLVGGLGLALGYLNRPELTAEKFIADPFAETLGERLYRTGDRVRRRADGNIEFLGRVDRQIKINGKRIELEEIESALRLGGLVAEAAAIARDTPAGQKVIELFVTPAAGTALDEAMLRQFFARELPDYMRPARITILAAMPLSPTGKIDRSRLPTATDAQPAGPAAPARDMTALVTAVWSRLLGAEAIRPDANFFDLGGTSLQLVAAHAQLERELGRRLPLVEFFEHPTIEALSRWLDPSDQARQQPDRNARPSGDGARATGVAVVGLAGRFPGADTIDGFWQNLCDGVESISRFEEAELDDWFDDETRHSPNFVRARPILRDIDKFDAEFFGMYANEAAVTDPQQRILLECAWEALEDGGYDPARYAGAIGVFAGASMNTYFLNNLCADRARIEQFTSGFQLADYATLVGNAPDFVATRIAYKLGLTGPAMTVQSACSTSLLAIAQACRSLLLGEADMALAGGVSISLPQQRGYLHQEGGMASADGHCRPFDADASGTVFGSGAGMVLLKRLEDALADGDRIYAVVRGAGINNDGTGKVGFTAPSAEGQAGAIEQALATAGVDARTVGYVECHGTATPLGDPIEIAGLTKAFRRSTGDRAFCALGSVKANVGHLDVAAGVTGFIKTALALKHKVLPPTLHYRRANPQIDFESSPFYVNAALTPWPAAETPRRAGVSSFGVGGTNVHIVLEEAPEPAAAEADAGAGPQLLTLSARSATALAALERHLADHLGRHPDLPLADVAATLQSGRRAFAHRLGIVAQDTGDAAAQLRAGNRGRIAPDRVPEVAFLFPGQGAQYAQMGRDLYDGEPVFRLEVDRCAEILRPLMGLDIRTVLYPDPADEAANRPLVETLLAQPAIFTVEYALARLWQSWGVQPKAMIGHSIGEFVVACLAGVFSLEAALEIIAARGRLMQDLPGGAMLAVRLPHAELAPLLTPPLAVAAINGPALTVVAGPHDAVARFAEQLAARDIMCRPLHTSHAFHSPMMDAMVGPLRDVVARLELAPPRFPYVSTVTGDWIRPEDATSPDYWARHAREPVLFEAAITTLFGEQPPVLLEAGPGNVLTTLALQAGRDRGLRTATSLPDAGREQGDRTTVLAAAAILWSEGVPLDWPTVRQGRGRRISLPTYPFQRTRHWVDPPARAARITDVSQAPVVQAAPDQTLLSQDMTAMSQAAAPATDRRAALEAQIIATLVELSGESLSAADAGASFLEMGFDSLFLGQVAQRLSNDMKVKLTFRQLLGAQSSPEKLARYLDEQMPAAASPPPAAAPTAAPVASPAAMPLASAPSTAALPGIEGLFRDQMNAMTALFNQQLETLRQGGQAMPTPAVAAPAPAAPIVPAPIAAAPAAAPASAAEEAPSRFQVYKAGDKSAQTEMSEAQQRHLDELIAQFNGRTARSKRLTQQHRAHLADPRAAAGFRATWKEMVYPIVAARSKGSKIWDVDGNEYVDLVNGYGQTAFGHAPDFVVKAVNKQLEDGFAIGPQAELAGKIAELFCEMTGNERVTFCNTGSEAVMAALRIARAVTGRTKVATFNGDYHGQFDEVLVKGVGRSTANPRSLPVAPGIANSAVENMVVLDYGTPAALEWIRAHADELAAVIVEPVQSRHPHLRPYDFLKEIRQITEASGTAFIMDEVVTGFRVHPGGMQAVTGIRADMATYGKVVGGGLPIGILAGKAAFMDALDGGAWQYGDDSIPEAAVTFFAGTFVRHPLTLAATWAVLNHLKSQGPALQEALTEKTVGLVERLRQLFAAYGIATPIEQFSSFFYFSIGGEHPLATLLFHHLRSRGIHIQDGFPCFLTTEHSAADLDAIVHAFDESLAVMSAAGIFRGRSDRDVGGPAAAPAPDGAPLTESQFEIWLSAQMGDEASCAFNESITITLDGMLDRPALQAALDQLIARHDSLRARFAATGETFTVAPAAPFEFAVHTPEPAEAEAALADVIETDAHTPFDLVAGPVVRAHLVRLRADSHALVLTAHHIVCDGWSINVMVNELAEIYAGQVAGRPAKLDAPLSFAAYAAREAAEAQKHGAASEAYWTKAFATVPSPLELPTDRPRSNTKSFRGSSLCRRIDADLYRDLKTAGAKRECTLFVTLLAAFEALMGRLSGQDEVVVGVPTAGQSLIEDEAPLVGHCVNFLPIRGRWDAGTTLGEHMSQVSKQVLDAYEHQNYTFGTLVRKLQLPREMNRLPLTEIQFNLERLAERIQLPGLAVEVRPNAKAFVNFDIFLNVIESKQGLRIDCDYNTELFDSETIERWLDYYQMMLRAIAADAGQPLQSVDLLPLIERDRFLVRANATERPFPDDMCVHQLFEAQARRTPNARAVTFGNRSMTYGELDQAANRLAHHLLNRIGNPNQLVGICVERSIDMLVAMLGTWKAGCAYVPLDPSHPIERRRMILSEAGIAALLVEDMDAGAAARAGVPVIGMSQAAGSFAAAPTDNPPIVFDAKQTAYVIYTSGSTGRPKGVNIPHRAVVNLLTSMAREPGLGSSDVLLAVTTIAFDIAALELFLPLITGATVAIAAREETRDGFQLLAAIAGTGATVMQATPAMWTLLVEAGFRSRPGFKMLCGGEALPRKLANLLLEGGGELWNMYGPTETTIWSSCGRVLPGDGPITIGRPIANTTFYILDRFDRPVPVGVPGQLHIGGVGLAVGYHGRPELTAKSFIPSPLRVGSGRLYRTGDVARRLPDGEIVLSGRIDHQVKLRGYRVELGEIEAVLGAVPGVSACAVALQQGATGNAQLVGYIVPARDNPATTQQARAAVALTLPDYMVPAAWVVLDAMPMSGNGKVDRAALPAPQAAPVTAARGEPRTPLEHLLVKIWKDVLKLDEVGIGDDLLDLGADSIHFFQITARANREGVRLAAKQLLALRTIEALAEHLETNGVYPTSGNSGGAEIIPVGGRLAKTPADEARAG